MKILKNNRTKRIGDRKRVGRREGTEKCRQQITQVEEYYKKKTRI